MEVIEQNSFKSELDIMKLNIIDWNRLNGSWRNPADALRTISSWFVGKAMYTIAREDLKEFPERDDWPGWQHAGNRHERLGRLYWNAFYYSEMGILVFGDEPDFSGRLIFPDYERDFYGDIGKVSAQCFAMTQKRMRKGDLWISVLDERMQMIIEAGYDIAAAYEKNMGIV